MKISIAVPAFHEEETITKLLNNISKKVKTSHEILIIYDTNTDPTVNTVKEYLEISNKKNIKLIKNSAGNKRGVTNAMKTGFMKAYSRKRVLKDIGVETERQGWMWWIRKHEEKFVELISAGVSVKVVWPERMVDADYHQMKEAISWTQLKWNGVGVMNFIEPKLWKARQYRR